MSKLGFPDKLKGKKLAVYLRRSEGEKGSTKDQLKRIEKSITSLEKYTGRKINRTIVGKDINNKKRFNAKKDLAIKGDIYNEGEGASGFKTTSRPVFMELVSRIEDGKYDGIVVETFDRVSRDILGLSHLALPLWREQGKIVYGLKDGKLLDNNLKDEALLVITEAANSLTKLGEIDKAKETLFGDAIDRGFLKGAQVEFLGTKGKEHGLSYRKAWNLMQAYGENKKDPNKPNKPSTIAKEFNKTNRWVYDFYKKMKEYNQAGVLEDWLTAIEKMNDFVRSTGGYPRNQWKSNPEIQRIRSATAGWFGYPAGVKVEATNEFVEFPNPNEIDWEQLKLTDNPMTLEGWEVKRQPYDNRNLLDIQTQPRSRAGGKR